MPMTSEIDNESDSSDNSISAADMARLVRNFEQKEALGE